MNTPSKQDLISAGYRMSVNTADAIVSRAALIVKMAYLLAYVSEQEISDATSADTIGQAWLALTFLRLVKDNEFATRTGGERKNNQYGQRIEYGLEELKSECNMLLRKIEDEHPKKSKVFDICEVYFKTQLLG